MDTGWELGKKCGCVVQAINICETENETDNILIIYNNNILALLQMDARSACLIWTGSFNTSILF